MKPALTLTLAVFATLGAAGPALAVEQYFVGEEGGEPFGVVFDVVGQPTDGMAFQAFVGVDADGQPAVGAMFETRFGLGTWHMEGVIREGPDDRVLVAVDHDGDQITTTYEVGGQRQSQSTPSDGPLVFGFEVIGVAMALGPQEGAQAEFVYLDLQLQAEEGHAMRYAGVDEFEGQALHRFVHLDAAGADRTYVLVGADGLVTALVDARTESVLRAVAEEEFQERICSKEAFDGFMGR
jgi:hypothetical protein